MSQNNTKQILAKLADRISDFQEKLTDSEYKDLCEGLGQIYKEVDRMSSPNLFQTNAPIHIQDQCLCTIFAYKCYQYSRFTICNSKERIVGAVPLINRVFRMLTPINSPEIYTPNDRYTMFLTQGYRITTILISDVIIIKTLSFLYKLSNRNECEPFAIKFLIYICITNLILSKNDVFKAQNSSYNQETIIVILNKIIDFLGKPLLPQQINLSGVQQYIYQELSIENIVILINSLLDIKQELLEHYNMANEVQVNLEPPTVTVINNHPMTTRHKKQVLPNNCSFTYKRSCSLVVNGAIHKYNQGDRCKLNQVENSKFCEKHTK